MSLENEISELKGALVALTAHVKAQNALIERMLSKAEGKAAKAAPVEVDEDEEIVAPKKKKAPPVEVDEDEEVIEAPKKRGPKPGTKRTVEAIKKAATAPTEADFRKLMASFLELDDEAERAARKKKIQSIFNKFGGATVDRPTLKDIPVENYRIVMDQVTEAMEEVEEEEDFLS